MNSVGDKKGGSDVAPPSHMAWTSAPAEPAAPLSEARTQRGPRGALEAPSLAGPEGGSERQMSRRNEDDDNGEEEVTKFAFSFPSPKRERKPSDEEQVETKRLKSPGRQDAQQGEQHGDSNTVLQMMEKMKQEAQRLKEVMDKGFAGPSKQHKGDGSKRE